VETNGTRTPSSAFTEAVDQFNVSPKLSNSGVKKSLRLAPDTLRFFASSPKAWFKFVIAAMADLDEVIALKNEFSIPDERILLMPEGRTSADLDQSAPAIAELCRQHGFRFCDRLHIRLWGDKRGV
jgi:organic radical activating enzyme